ncbi:IucA/IucC family C-terminal-domain containing protein, partial [Gemmatimonadota bacterium]
FLEFGLILEPHGQNVLLEVDAGGTVRRIVHRDLSMGIDMRRRRDLQLPDEDLNNYNRMESGQFNSIAYDKFMGGHFFDHLLALLEQRFPGLEREDFRSPCRDEFARLFPEHSRYLPRTIHYFSEERDQFGKPLFQDTGRAPAWRP